jgi:hypothetical protein
VHNYEGRLLEYLTPEGTRVVNAYGYHVVEMDFAAPKKLVQSALV